ncbi:MAG: NAD-dependent epimerase/dehydratase family protein [Thermoplasmata archaeon]
MKKTILITGATGFIGSNLTHYLIESGEKDIHIFIRKNSNLWRIKDIIQKLNVYEVDLLNKEKLKKVIYEIKPDLIFHNAAYGVTHRSQQDIDLLINTNFIGSVNLLNILKELGFKSFINAGSSFEYGLLSKEYEEDDLPNPIDVYGVTKLAFTNYCRMLSLTEGLPIVTLRLFSTYGYYESPLKLIPYLIINMLKNNEIILNTPYAKRDFIFIEDVIDAFIKTAEKIQKIPNGTIIDIGSGNEYNVLEVFEILNNIMGSKSNYKLSDNYLLKDKSHIWKAKIKKAKEIIDWEPKYNLEEGLAKNVDWFKKNLKLYEGLNYEY